MTAISKAWVTLTDAATDADSPVDQALVQGIRDDTVHLREWLGASYTAGAVQDHNHDGVNSALVPVGPNALRNGSFESGTDGWTLTAYTGGTVAQNAADMDGNFSLGITSTVLANGGGTALSNEYVACSGGRALDVSGMLYASAAGVSARLEVVWYDAAKALISATNVYDIASAPVAAAVVRKVVDIPATARFYKIRCTGGVPATGTSVGTVYFDGILVSFYSQRDQRYSVATTSGASQTITGLPAWARQITAHLEGVSHNSGGASIGLRGGTAGGIEASGYVSAGYNAAGTTTFSSTTEVATNSGTAAAQSVDATVVFTRVSETSNKWHVVSSLNSSSGASDGLQVSFTTKTFAAALDRIQIFISAGAFDAGTLTLEVR